MTVGSDRLPDARFGIVCAIDGEQGITDEDYNHQMSRPNNFWICPICKDIAQWDDDRYEARNP